MVDDFIIKVFEGQEIDFIEIENKIWITSSAIGKGLDIDRKNINQIYINNRELLDPYTTIMKIMTVDNKRRESVIWF